MTRPDNFNQLQHYLPVGYLKNFTDDTSSRSTRNRKTWAYSKTTRSLNYLKLKYLCSEKAFYSTDGQKEFLAHDPIDRNLSLAIERFRTTRLLNVAYKDRLGYELLIQGCYLRVRGKSIDKRTAANRILAADMAVRSFINIHLLGIPNANAEQRVQALKEKWSTCKLTGPKGWPLFTSDNPVMFFNRNKEEICLIIFPVDQKTYFVAYKDNRAKIISTRATPNDAALLISYTVANAHDYIISPSLNEYNPADFETFHFPPRTENFIDDKFVQLSAFDFEGVLNKLSFVRLLK